MATEDTEYIDDAILQMMACNVRPFSKNDIIEWGSTVLHTRLKSSQSFLARYEGKVIESIGANKNNVERYYLKPEKTYRRDSLNGGSARSKTVVVGVFRTVKT